MTAKIMARVRDDEAPAPSFWRRYVFPIMASAQFRVASLVLVGAAGYYIVSRSTAPPPPARSALREEKKDAVQVPTAPAPQVAAAPDLDERKEAPPLAADAAAPTASEAAGSAAPSAAAAPAIAAARPQRLSQAAPAPGGAAGSLRARESAKAERAAPTIVIRLLTIRIDSFDPSGFPTLVERELSRAGADIVSAPGRTDGHSVAGRLESRRLPELLDRLARIGTVREGPETLDGLPSVITVTIRW